ncbi:MAG: flagellar hook basal-body protein [Planctomycetes bacterium]|nr:flagellar hook basal-body protein [Planctomycetota bacterium]
MPAAPAQAKEAPMALRTLGIAASGINAQLAQQASAASNSANALTPAFAPTRVSNNSLSGGGVSTQSARVHSHGSLIITGNPLDLAIGGAGFFVLGDKKALKLSRDGRFSVDAEGYLVSIDGERLTPEIRFSSGTQNAHISRYGDVIAQGERGREYIGTIELATVSNPLGLRVNGGTALEVTAAAGRIVRGFPGESGFGLLVQGGIEASSTSLDEEILSAIVAVRAFSANARVLRLAAKTSEELADLIARHQRRKGGAGSTDIDLRRSQVADLVSRMPSGTSRLAGQPLSEEVRAHLRARRLSAAAIAKEPFSARSALIERFTPTREDAEASSSFLAQEIRLARRRGFEIYQRRLGA